MSIPDWWEALLLAGAAWRVFYFLGEDDLLDRPRRYLTRLGKSWQNEGDPVPSDYRLWLGQFLQCPYCLGLWVAIAWWGAWEVWPSQTLIVAVPFMLSAAVVGAHKALAS